jgi:putative ABC transport system permease protein
MLRRISGATHGPLLEGSVPIARAVICRRSPARDTFSPAREKLFAGPFHLWFAGKMLRELRSSFRLFVREPGFALVVVLTLALGIGANTAIFSLIYGILLRPFPYVEPDRLVRIQSVDTARGRRVGPCSLMDVDDLRSRNRTLVDLGAHSGSFDSDLRGEGAAEPILLNQLQPQALSILGVAPVVGRLFRPEEDLPGGDVHKALISYRLWQDRYGGNPGIVGRTIQTNQATLTVVGVMPPGFGFPTRTDVWTPMESYYAVSKGTFVKRRDARIYSVIARLKPGVTLEQAHADLEGVAAGLEREYPKENRGIRLRLISLREAEAGNLRPYLVLLLSAVAFVLLIGCANVANLLLARGAMRERETAIRAALGAGRRTIVCAHLVESATLSIAGGLIGVGLAFLGVRALATLIPVPLPFWMKIEVNATVLLFALGASLVTGLLFGLIPALSASRIGLQPLLKEGSRGSSARGRLRGALVAAESALAVMLLTGAGLMMQSFLRLQHAPPGFGPDGLLVARVTQFQPGRRAERAALLAAFHERVLERLRAIPGVVAAGGGSTLPYGDTREERRKDDISIKGRSDEETRRTVSIAGADVSPGYLETMRIPLIRGRYFNQRDTSSSMMSLIINERAAKQLFPGMDPIGQQIRWGTPTPDNPYCTVVGVVGNIRHRAAESEDGLELYYPYSQYGVSSIYYMVRANAGPERLVASVRSAIRAVDPNAPIVWVKPMEQIMDESLWQRRLWGVLLVVFAALALVLAAVGIYSVLSYVVGQRTREIGIRMALGAQKTTVLRMVLRAGLGMVLAGSAVGLTGAVLLSRLIRSLLYGVSATDPVTLALVPSFLAVVALAACYLPARRAASVDPLVALRQE